jgi:hypothetical protein
MAVKYLSSDRSSAFLHRISDGLNTGAGQDDHLSMAANWTGYRERGWVDFPMTSGFWSDMATVSKVELEVSTTGSGVHVGRGSSPGFWIRRAVENAHPNGRSMDGGGSANTDPDVYPGPEARSGDQVWATYGTTSSDTTQLYDITDMAREWMPTSIPGGHGGTCYGLRLDQGDSTNNTAEVYSARAASSRQPRLRVTYVPKAEAVPRAPSLVIPVGTKVNASRFDLTSADALTTYDLQVSTDKLFKTVTHWNLVTSSAGLVAGGKSVSVAYGGLALAPDPTKYWWRARGRNGYGPGAWSSAVSFTSDPAATPKDQLDRWAATVLEALAAPRHQVLLGQLIPEGEQVAQLTGTSPGGRWRVTDAGHGALLDRIVEMVGVSLSADVSGWYVDVVTHDLGPIDEVT